jgi:hypothetical protein
MGGFYFDIAIVTFMVIFITKNLTRPSIWPPYAALQAANYGDVIRQRDTNEYPTK